MAEFAGYSGFNVKPNNYGDITRRTLGDLADVEAARKKERLDFENEYADNMAKLGEVEATTNQGMTQFLFNGINSGRDMTKDWYDAVKKGEMTMSDYKLRQKTLSSDWSTMNKFIKEYENITKRNADLIAKGEMSNFGTFRAQQLAALGDLKGAKLMISPEGRVFRAQVDDKGNIISKNDLVSVNTLLNPANQADLKIDLMGGIKTFVDNISKGAYTTDRNLGGGVTLKETSPIKNPAYQKALKDQLSLYTANPRSAASVLSDYVGGYDFYSTESEKKQAIANGVPESNLIKVTMKDGISQPELTSEQETKARDYVKNLIESGIHNKQDITPGWKPSVGRQGDGVTESEKTRQQKQAIVAKKNDIGNSIFQNPRTSPHLALLVNAAMKSGLDKVQVMSIYPPGLPPEKRSPENRTGIQLTGLRKAYNERGEEKAEGELVPLYFKNPQQVSAYIEGAINTGYDAYAEGLMQNEGGVPQVQQPIQMQQKAPKPQTQVQPSQAKIVGGVLYLPESNKNLESKIKQDNPEIKKVIYIK